MALQKQGTVSEALKGCAALAQEEALALTGALGGIENISEQRTILLRDSVRLGLLLRVLMSQFLQGVGDPDLATRIATITTARRTLLQTLGLERVANEVPDLHDYIRDLDAQKDAGATIANASDAEVVEPESAAENVNSSPHSRVATPEARGNGDGVAEGLSDSAQSHAVANDSTSAGPNGSGAEENQDDSNAPT